MTDEALFYLSAGQQHLLGQAGEGPVLRHQVLVAAPEGPSPETLSERWAAMTDRYDVLHVAFRKPTGLAGLLQTTDAPAAPLVVADEESVVALADREWAQPLDLASGGLVRAAYGAGHLVVTAAAAVADPASLRLLATELLTGAPAEEDPLPFLDYAAWEAEQLSEDTADSRVAKAYWRGLVGDLGDDDKGSGRTGPAADPRALPLDGAGDPEPDQWLAAFATVRRRHVAADDALAVVAVAVSGRTDDELESSIGPFERYVPVLVPADGQAGLAATTSRLTADVEAAARFAMFAPRPLTVAAFSARPAEVRPAVGRFAVELTVTGSTAALWYDAGRVSEVEAGWLADQVTAAAVAIRDQPDLALDDVDLVGAGERAFLEAALTGEGAAARHPSVPAALASHAQERPDVPAVVHGDAVLSYRDLDSATRRVAVALAGGESAVAILLDRSLDAVVAALGAMRAGRPYVALEPSHPAERLAVQLETAGVDTVITSPGHADALPATVTPMVLVELPEPAPDAPDEPVTGGHLAYLLFTSGSTGTPKAVAVTQDNLVSYVAGVSARLGLGPESRMASITGLSTDLGNTSVYGALVNGGTLELVPDDAVTSGAHLGELVREHAITALKITPSHLRALLAGGDVRLELPLLVSGGEPLDVELVEQARAAGVGRVVNHYGPTETTIGVFSHELGEQVEAPIPLGRPLPHVRARVVDARGRDVPVGVVGELEIAGSAVTAGYLGDQGASGFGEDDAGGRRYRTGDLVVVGLDGDVTFVGRADGQVKVRGFRVDLGEVEVRLRGEAGVAEAAAVVVDDAIQAFVVTPDRPLDVTAALDRMRRQLPAHMVPVSVAQVAELPRTPSGKIDRTTLTQLASSGAATSPSTGRAPTTETETTLLEIWREVMPGAVAGVDDNFFQVGGHSLLATKVIARSRAVFSVDLPLHVIFASPTVATMATEIDARREPEDALDALMADLEGMSDEEVARLLEEEPRPRRDDA